LLKEMQHGSRRIKHSVWRKLNIFNWLVTAISYTLARLLIGALINYRVGDDI